MKLVNLVGLLAIQVKNIEILSGGFWLFKENQWSNSKFSSILEGFTDANWISNVCENKSILGWVFTFGGGAVSWKSKKQTYIT